ncbi:MAG TPA: LysR family transcriptional regulator [Acidobacteriaceae bacterium]
MSENDRLTIFRAVAAERGFRPAAEHLYLTQPAIAGAPIRPPYRASQFLLGVRYVFPGHSCE